MKKILIFLFLTVFYSLNSNFTLVNLTGKKKLRCKLSFKYKDQFGHYSKYNFKSEQLVIIDCSNPEFSGVNFELWPAILFEIDAKQIKNDCFIVFTKNHNYQIFDSERNFADFYRKWGQG